MGLHTNEKTRPGKVVEGVEQEDTRNDDVTSRGVGSSLVKSLDSESGTDSLEDVHSQHTTSGSQEELPSAKLVDSESHTTGNDHIPDVKDTVDNKLSLLVGDTNHVEHLGHVVRDKRVTGPLGEETSSNADGHSVTVTLGAPQLRDTRAPLGLKLELDGLLDLNELIANQFIVLVSVGVVLGEDLKRFLVTVTGDEPPGGFRNKPDGQQHDGSRSSLEDRWNTPTPGAVDVEGAIGGPGSDDGTDVPGGVIEGGNLGTMLHVGQLGDKKRGGTVSEGDTETNLWDGELANLSDFG